MSETLLRVENLSLSFLVGGEPRPVVHDLSFEVAAKESFGLVGESGSGKSTVLLAVMNYLAENARVDGGQVWFRGRDLLTLGRAELDRIRGRHIAMVYQDPGTALNPSMTVGRQICETVERHLDLEAAAARDHALAYLEKVHLDHPGRAFSAYPHQLSGGQRQRAMIALALSCEPELLLMDEPTTALDVVVQARILELVRELSNSAGAGIVFVTHDLGAVAQVADRLAVLYAGELMETGSARQVLGERRHPYTRGLVAALPKLRRRALPRSIRGIISRDPARFQRCVFAGRCPWTDDACRERPPPLHEVADGWRSRCHFADRPEKLSAAPDDEPDFAQAADDRAAQARGPLLEVRRLEVEYRRPLGLVGLLSGRKGAAVKAVRGLSLALHPERTLAVVGESGSGKTTLAHAILRLLPAAAGEIRFSGEEIGGFSGPRLQAYRRSVEIVFQNPTSSLNPRKTVAELVARPLVLAGATWRAARKSAQSILPEVGLDEGYLPRLPAELSGGEKQRVALARAFVGQPKLVILDEPTTSLDVSVQATVLRLLARLKARHRCAYLLISHDLAIVRQLADEVIVMRAGEVCESGPVERIFERPGHAYTRELLAAVPTFEVVA